LGVTRAFVRAGKVVFATVAATAFARFSFSINFIAGVITTLLDRCNPHP
jgi:hypothetical protein